MENQLIPYQETNIGSDINENIYTLLQNGAMGFVVGALIFSEIQYLIPITIYALLQYCFLLLYPHSNKK